mmetsp:Transcript_45001/g.75076  ORF Transcript_45001/g.75076 Transcript_45001/m.75076 type:complete len:444 (+) Transcript_45001:98-1429(+)
MRWLMGTSINQRRLLTAVSAACVVCLLCALLLEKPNETHVLKFDAIPNVTLPKTDPAQTQTERKEKELERRERALQQLDRRERALQEREERALQELERNKLEVEGLALANLRANLDMSSEVSNVPLTDNCCRIETRYEPSPWEAKWAKDILKYNVDMTQVVPTRWPGCRVMAEDDKQTQQWLEQWKGQNDANGKFDPVTWSREVFSRHVFYNVCTKEVVHEVPIEPLVSFLRHPRAVCTGATHDLDKDYMLVPHRREWDRIVSSSCGAGLKCRRSFFFDLGASTYRQGIGGASLSWFVESYKERGILFDRVLAWEPTVIRPEAIFADFPSDILGRLSYYNVPVSAVAGNQHNPLSILRNVVEKSDFVVLKIDIDTPHIEEALVQQILADPSLAGLIDEMFFEHHVTGVPMAHYWQNLVGKNVVESYNIFQTLRRMGIRAHSWV